MWSLAEILSAPFWCLCQKLFLSPLYFNKTLLHKSSEQSASSLAPNWILLLQGPRIPVSSRDSTTTFHLGGSSGILQDKVRMLGALVLCSLNEHVFCCALLTLRCACVNEWHALSEASKEPCSAVPWWSHTAYGRNLSGRYTDLPMPRGTQCLLRKPTRNGQSVWTELSFLGQTFQSLWPFHNSMGIRSTNLIYRRRQWHPTPVFLPGESQGRRSLVGGCLWGCTESDTTEAT